MWFPYLFPLYEEEKIEKFSVRSNNNKKTFSLWSKIPFKNSLKTLFKVPLKIKCTHFVYNTCIFHCPLNLTLIVGFYIPVGLCFLCSMTENLIEIELFIFSAHCLILVCLLLNKQRVPFQK